MKNPILKLTISLLLVFIIVNNWIFIPGNILSWDVFGYYLYLPLKFIYNNLGLHNDAVIHSIIDKYNNTATFYQAIRMPEGNYVMKYSMGMSVFYLPFFIIGHVIAILFDYQTDGFSLPYQYSIFVGSIIYTIIGIIVLAKVLIQFFNEKISALVLIIIVFATNYIVHITMYGQNAMSHNYLFTTYALILWLTIIWNKSHKIKHAIFLALICGLTILSRPSEIVCLLIPILWGVYDKKTAIDKIKLFVIYKYQLILFVIILLIIGSSQFIYWKIQTGKFLFNSYGGNAGEGFEFFRPYIFEVLFSFRKGWLIYTPVMIFALFGFVFLYKRNKPIFYTILIFFIFNLYIFSSWSCWWYAQSFSQRSLIQIYPIMALLLGYLLTWLCEQKYFIKYTGFLLLSLCIFLNIFQTRQFYFGIIDGDRMTKAYYFRVFGKMHTSEQDKKLLLINRSFDGSEFFLNESEYNSKILKKIDFENSEKVDSSTTYSGKYSFKLDSSKMYSPTIEAQYNVITKSAHAWIRVSAYIYPVFDIKTNPFSLIIQFNHNDYPYKYKGYDSENMHLELNKWNKISLDYLTPEVRNKKDYLKVYLWHRGHNALYIDDLQVEVFDK